MTARFQPLLPAQPAFTESGVAKSLNYDDVYHSTAGALAQADYVFLGANHLPERWQHKSSFTICETGFGLGNNFLTTWLRWRTDVHRSQKLHYLSFEAHPFDAKGLQQMLKSSPEAIRDLAQQLIAQWPPLLPGVHRLDFENGDLSLTLVFGDISQKAKRVEAKVDAYYLDGFAPRVNPDMWSRRLFGQLVRMAAKGATAASWCSAGQVRRDLQDAGFLVTKRPGFAHKREMIQAQLRPNLGRDLRVMPEHAVVVGAGIAGASTAAALARRGIRVTVIDPVLAQGAGAAHLAHRALAMTPMMTSDDAPRARLSRAGVLLAKRYWKPLAPVAFHEVGALAVADTKENGQAMRKAVEVMSFPETWVRYLDAQQLATHTDTPVAYGGLYFPEATLVDPEALIAGLLHHPLITLQPASVSRIVADGEQWMLELQDQTGASLISIKAECVVMCNSISAPKLALQAFPELKAPRFLAMQRLPGQVSFYNETDFAVSSSAILAGNGYLLPALQGVRVGGSTYGEPSDAVHVSEAGHRHIAQTLDRWRTQLKAGGFEAFGGWAGLRAATSDRLPVFSHVSKGFWLNCAYGSNGFSWAALCAEELAAQLANEPSLLERDLSQAVGLR